MFKLIFRRNPLLILLGGLVSGLGSMMMSFALSLYVLDITGSGAKFASVLAMALVPRLILGPFAGILSDRISRKKTMVVLDAISGSVTLVFAFFFIKNTTVSLTSIYVLVFLLTTISIFFEPSSTAIIPDVIQKKDLPKYNSTVQFFFTFVRFFSPVIAGLLYGTVGIYTLVIINGVSFLLSAISEMFIKIEKESLEKVNKDSTFLKSFIDGVKFIKSTYAIMLLMLFALIGNLAYAPIISVGFNYILRQDLHVSEVLYGSAQSIIMVGLIVGTLFVTALNRKYHFLKVIVIFFTILGALCLAFGIVAIPNINIGGIYGKYIVVVAIATIMLTITTITNISSRSGMQMLVPNDLMGRVFGVKNTIGLAAVPLGQIIFGALLDVTYSYIVVMIFTAIIILSSIVYIALFTRARKQGKLKNPVIANKEAV